MPIVVTCLYRRVFVSACVRIYLCVCVRVGVWPSFCGQIIFKCGRVRTIFYRITYGSKTNWLDVDFWRRFGFRLNLAGICAIPSTTYRRSYIHGNVYAAIVRHWPWPTCWRWPVDLVVYDYGLVDLYSVVIAHPASASFSACQEIKTWLMCPESRSDWREVTLDALGRWTNISDILSVPSRGRSTQRL